MSPPPSLLVVDDQASVALALSEMLSAAGYDVRIAASAEDALAQLAVRGADLVVSDVQLPGQSGMDLLEHLRQRHPDTEIILITGHGTIETAVTAIKAGAFDFLTKPVRGMDLEVKVHAALERKSLKRELERLRDENAWLRAESLGETGNLVGRSRPMRRVMEMVARVAVSDSTVLIRGESGTGKELVARAIHLHSPRRDRPFVKLNAAAMPEGLLESELFGHEKGAFTGAIKRKMGRFELARDGTLFLDEIGDISPAAQVKLLRVLQERTFERVGGLDPIRAECRILAATHQDLEARVETGQFRQDLYYRLNVVPITLPPLRDRKDDLPDLVTWFLNKFGQRLGKEVSPIPSEILARFMAYDWPGNIRELENLIERAVVLGGLSDGDLPAQMGGASGGASGFQLGSGVKLADYLDAVERALIERAFRDSAGNKSRAAALLGMDRNLFRYKLAKYHLEE